MFFSLSCVSTSWARLKTSVLGELFTCGVRTTVPDENERGLGSLDLRGSRKIVEREVERESKKVNIELICT